MQCTSELPWSSNADCHQHLSQDTEPCRAREVPSEHSIDLFLANFFSRFFFSPLFSRAQRISSFPFFFNTFPLTIGDLSVVRIMSRILLRLIDPHPAQNADAKTQPAQWIDRTLKSNSIRFLGLNTTYEAPYSAQYRRSATLTLMSSCISNLAA